MVADATSTLPQRAMFSQGGSGGSRITHMKGRDKTLLRTF